LKPLLTTGGGGLGKDVGIGFIAKAFEGGIEGNEGGGTGFTVNL
jgi:hypothetical protein